MKTVFAIVLGAAICATVSLAAQQPAACAPSGGLTFICGPVNAEDVVPVPNTRWLVASGMAPGSGLHLVDTQAKTVKKAYAAGVAAARHDKAKFAACPGPLDAKQMVVHGLAIRPAGAGKYTVYATNHGGRESVEVFELSVDDVGRVSRSRPGEGPTATWVGCVVTPGVAFNSVAAFTDGTIVGTVLIKPGTTFADAFAQKNTGYVMQWKPGTSAFVQIPGTDLSANNGIETSPDDKEFYVASTTAKRIYAFARAGGKPLRIAQLKEIGPDNVRWTPDNRLITAGMIDDEKACGGPPKTEEDIRCPRGYVVDMIDPKTMAVTELARGPRTSSFTGVAMAALVNNELWLGSFFADRLAYRSLK